MNNTERKYRKKVNQNGWMARIHYWTFGTKPNYVGYCPFFWMAWFCLLISPLTAIGKLGEFFLGILGKLFTHKPTQTSSNYVYQEITSFDDVTPRKPSINEMRVLDIVETPDSKDFKHAHDLYYHNYNVYVSFSTLKQFMSALKWTHLHPNWKQILKTHEEKQKAHEEKMAVLKEQKQKIVKYASYAVKPALFLSAVGSAYLIYLLIMFFLATVNIKALIGVIFFLAFLVVAVFACVLAISLLIKVCSSLQSKFRSIPDPTVGRPKNPNFLEIFVSGVGEGISFLLETVEMIYKKECPLIEWGDEEGKIEKNKK